MTIINNTTEARNELNGTGNYAMKIMPWDIEKAYVIRFDNLQGSEKQIAFAIDKLNKRLTTLFGMCNEALKKGKTREEVEAKMAELITQIEAIDSAKYVIEKF